MKKIIIVLGGSVELYLHYFKLFQEVESQFNCIVRRIGIFKFVTNINNARLEFKFCKNPTRDNNYRSYKKYLEDVIKELLPPPADEVIKKNSKISIILFFGFCGAFTGKTGEICVPEVFKEISFKTNFIKKSDIFGVKPQNTTKIKNLLTGKIISEKSVVITSNLSLTPDYVENGDEGLILLGKKLSAYGDVIDKESFKIAQCSRKIPMGFMLMTSDSLYDRNQMIRNKQLFEPDIKKFNKACIDSIKVVLKE